MPRQLSGPNPGRHRRRLAHRVPPQPALCRGSVALISVLKAVAAHVRFRDGEAGNRKLAVAAESHALDAAEEAEQPGAAAFAIGGLLEQFWAARLSAGGPDSV